MNQLSSEGSSQGPSVTSSTPLASKVSLLLSGSASRMGPVCCLLQRAVPVMEDPWGQLCKQAAVALTGQLHA